MSGKAQSLAQVGFDPAALVDACEINRKISQMTNVVLKKQENLFYQYLSFKSVYLPPCENDKPLCKCKLFSDSHSRCSSDTDSRLYI